MTAPDRDAGLLMYQIGIASIHESGHAVVALSLGGSRVKCKLSRDHSRDICVSEQIEGVCFRQHGEHGKLATAAVGYAGAVAECLDDELHLTAEEVLDYIANDATRISPSDWASVNTIAAAWHGRALRLALATLKSHWPTVLSFAAELEDNYDRKGEHCEVWFHSLECPMAGRAA